mgnify:CR=1 FL=1
MRDWAGAGLMASVSMAGSYRPKSNGHIEHLATAPWPEVRDLLQWMCDWNQAHPGDPVEVGHGLRQGVERRFLAQVTQEAQDQAAGDAQLLLTVLEGGGNTVEHHFEWNAPVGVGLGVIEDFRMHPAVGVQPQLDDARMAYEAGGKLGSGPAASSRKRLEGVDTIHVVAVQDDVPAEPTVPIRMSPAPDSRSMKRPATLATVMSLATPMKPVCSPSGPKRGEETLRKFLLLEHVVIEEGPRRRELEEQALLDARFDRAHDLLDQRGVAVANQCREHQPRRKNFFTHQRHRLPNR